MRAFWPCVCVKNISVVKRGVTVDVIVDTRLFSPLHIRSAYSTEVYVYILVYLFEADTKT